jgi:DNA-binding response OmpR family regulator
MTRILVVEPDPLYRKLFPIWIRNHFGEANFLVLSAADAATAEASASEFRPDLLVTSFELEGGIDGLMLADRLRPMLGEMRVVLISKAASYAKLRGRLAKFPRAQFLAKPVGERTFADVMEAMLPCLRHPQSTLQESS